MNRIIAFLAGLLIAVSSAYAAKVPDETALGGAPASNDLIRMVDVSDTTQSAQGSTKSMTVANLFTSPTVTGVMTVADGDAGNTHSIKSAAGSTYVNVNHTIGGLEVFNSGSPRGWIGTYGGPGYFVAVNGGGYAWVPSGSWTYPDTIWAKTAPGIVEVANGSLGYSGTALRTGPQTVSQLPTCASGTEGARAYVTDSNATLAAGLGNTVAGSGSNKTPVFCDGSNWKIGG